MRALLIGTFLIISVYSVVEAQDILRAAAAPSNNINDCFCQCDSLTFRDGNNRLNGNCRTTFNGGQWCYITDDASRNGDCPDARSSRRFNGRRWSYHACATPTTRRCVLDILKTGGCGHLSFKSQQTNTRINLKSSAPSNSPDSP